MAIEPRKPGSLSPGDTISYSVSQEIPTRRSSTWVKCEGSTTIRGGETADRAKSRLVAFVDGWLAERIAEIME